MAYNPGAVEGGVPNPENIGKMVEKMFEELYVRLSNLKFHPSEEYERNSKESKQLSTCIYEVINSYHGFCKLCFRHFYTEFAIRDTNSYFQSHLNSTYHRELRGGGIPPDDVPMFTWERKYYTGRCNLCKMSGLCAFVYPLKSSPLEALEKHKCDYERENRETKPNILAKMNLLRYYCGLKLFCDKGLRTLNGDVFCVFCTLKLPWSEDQIKCHLVSYNHFVNFCECLMDSFSFSPTDILNGYNLEHASRAFILWTPTDLIEYEYVDLRERCFEESNNKPDEEWFCPLLDNKETFLGPEENDFFHEDKCVICIKEASPLHFISESHQKKVENLCLLSFSNKEMYNAFHENRRKRLRLLEIIKKLDSKAEEKDCTVGSLIRNLVEEKMILIDLLFTLPDEGVGLCQLCNMNFFISHERQHLATTGHMYFEEQWEYVKQNINHPKYVEPFQYVKNSWICYLCGSALQNVEAIAFHLMESTHIEKWEWYRRLNVGCTITKGIDLKEDYRASCNICKRVVLGYRGRHSLQSHLKKIRDHWPCPELVKMQREGRWMPLETKAKITLKEDESEEVFSGKAKLLMDGLIKHLEKSRDSAKTGSAVRQWSYDRPCTSREAKAQEEAEAAALGEYRTDTRLEEEDEKKGNADWEVLLVKGWTKHYLTAGVFLEKLRQFGQFLNVSLQKAEAVIVFAELGAAQRVAKNSDLVRQYNLSMLVTMRNLPKLAKQRMGSLDPKLAQLFTQKSYLLEFIMQLTAEANQVFLLPEEKEKDNWVCTDIVNAVSSEFPNAQCYTFGSRVSGLSLHNSDLDIFIDCGDMFNGFENTSLTSQLNILSKLTKLLRKKREIHILNVVARARVPIISFIHAPTQMRCDLSFKNGLSVRNTEVIRDLINLDWRVRPLILLFKYWAKVNGLLGSPDFSSYSISMLVIFYLQQRPVPILPAIEAIQNTNEPRVNIGGWDCTRDKSFARFKQYHASESLLELSVQLFEFYSSFDYENNVILPVMGRAVARDLFRTRDVTQIPMCYKRQILNLPLPLDCLVQSDIHICIIDPFDLSHVLTKSFGWHKLQMFKELCNISARHLKN